MTHRVCLAAVAGLLLGTAAVAQDFKGPISQAGCASCTGAARTREWPPRHIGSEADPMQQTAASATGLRPHPAAPGTPTSASSSAQTYPRNL
jgi:hypothetical protein